MKLSACRVENTVFETENFGNWTKNIDDISREFSTNTPFSHVIIDDFFSEKYVEELYNDFPSNDWMDEKGNKKWMSYFNPIEIKNVFDNVDEMPHLIQEMFYQINSRDFINLVKKITGIENLEHDPYLHGGGMHSIPQNGKLYMHLDYSIHPLSGKERRINLIIYMNKFWKEEWGGTLELWSKGMEKCVKKVMPIFNRAVLFQTFDESWHGHPDSLKCPENQSRKSFAVYYVSEPRKNATLRNKAQFVQRPTDVFDERIQKLLDIRVMRRISKEDLDEIYPDWQNVCF